MVETVVTDLVALEKQQVEKSRKTATFLTLIKPQLGLFERVVAVEPLYRSRLAEDDVADVFFELLLVLELGLRGRVCGRREEKSEDDSAHGVSILVSGRREREETIAPGEADRRSPQNARSRDP